MSEITLTTQDVCKILKEHIKNEQDVEITNINVEFDLEENKENKWEVIISSFKLEVEG